ncbi:SigE family RNA polymerase sigma factor [Phytohabitans sp. LJ34]|uniref:SigE family RNA polymerase sigma factor n=1 Tax=Phytohabitans sp. LJ34 TaxID=3452217 RepID=UPI003F8B3094
MTWELSAKEEIRLPAAAEVRDFDAFVKVRTPALLRAAYLLTGDQHLAEDLVQTSLAKAYRRWRRLRDPAFLEAYTRKVMYHSQISIWRRRRVPEWVTAEPPEPRGGAYTDAMAATDLRLSMRAALLKLSARQRAVLVLRFFEDCTEAEAAALLGVTIGTVKSQTSKALARLRVVAPELSSLTERREQ